LFVVAVENMWREKGYDDLVKEVNEWLLYGASAHKGLFRAKNLRFNAGTYCKTTLNLVKRWMH
jgi:hypothetical protein